MIADTRPRQARASAAALRKDFWARFREETRDVDISCSRASSDGWMWHTAGLSAGYLASLVNVRQGEVCVRFRLKDANADTVSSFLRAHRDRIDGAFEAPPAWRNGGRSHVIEQRRAADVLDSGSWPEAMSWLRRQLQDFQRALWPLVGRVPPAGARRRWDEGRFFRELTMWNPGCLVPAQTLLTWASDRGEDVQWGSGGQCGSFAPAIVCHGVAYRLVSVGTDGTLRLLFTALRDTPAFAARERRLEVLSRVNGLPHVRLAEETVRQRPAVPLALLEDPAAAGRMADLLDWFRAAVRSP